MDRVSVLDAARGSRGVPGRGPGDARKPAPHDSCHAVTCRSNFCIVGLVTGSDDPDELAAEDHRRHPRPDARSKARSSASRRFAHPQDDGAAGRSRRIVSHSGLRPMTRQIQPGAIEGRTGGNRRQNGRQPRAERTAERVDESVDYLRISAPSVEHMRTVAASEIIRY